MGFRTGDYNGCAWIATYNASKLLGENYHPADIVEYYETHGGTLINGELGVNPLGVKNFFKGKGFDSTMHSFPSELDSHIKDSTTSILTYRTGDRVHTVAVEYKYGRYYIYNEKNSSITATHYPSMDEWLKNGSNGEFVVSLITLK